MAQGHNRWPNLWELERWNGFDIGIVLGKSWADRWRQCACFYYVNPRCGTYEFGYPKSDYVDDISVIERAAEVKIMLGMPEDSQCCMHHHGKMIIRKMSLSKLLRILM